MWAAPDYHKSEGATPHPGVCKHSLRYDGRPDGGLGEQVGTYNSGSLSGKGEDCEELRKRMIDVCCLQEVSWGGLGARMLGMKGRRYNLWWSGKGDIFGGVGVMVKELCEKEEEVRRVGERVMTVVFEEDVLMLICGLTWQSGKSLKVKQPFNGVMKCEWDMHSVGDLVMCWCNFDGHVDGVHAGHGVGQRNLEGRMLLQLCPEKELCVSDTWSKRGKDGGLRRPLSSFHQNRTGDSDISWGDMDVLVC